MVQHGGLIDGAGVVVQAAGDGQVHGEVVLRHAEGGQISCHGVQLVQAQVKELVPAPVALQRGQDLVVGARMEVKLRISSRLRPGDGRTRRSAWLGTLSGPILSSLSTVRMMSPDCSERPSMA